jgi:A/G-specific adenine glycosylase
VTGPHIDDLAGVRRELLAWHAAHGLRAPWRESGDPYEALVAAVMAQQTQMSRVMPSYERFMMAFPTVESLAATSAGEVIRVWSGMGYNQRAIRLHRAARAIVADGWPRDAAGLARLDGIGPFTAAIVASFAFGQAAACVDTNVRRVLGRLAGDEGLDGSRLQELANAVMAAEAPARWNQALMDYGARVCTPRPKCGECVVVGQCGALRGAVREQGAESGEQRAGRQQTANGEQQGAAGRRRTARNGQQKAAGGLLLVADERGAYSARRKPQPKFEESARYYRGRIVDVLRGLAAGVSVAVDALPEMIANGRAAPSADDTLAWVAGLERHGLVVMREGRVALPE